MRLISQYIQNSNDDDGYELDCFLELFDELFLKIFPKKEVAMIAKCHGWRKQDGYRHAELFNNGSTALSKVTDGTAPSMRIYIARNAKYGYHIAINTAHHDSPTWDEWTYMVRPKYLKNSETFQNDIQLEYEKEIY